MIHRRMFNRLIGLFGLFTIETLVFIFAVLLLRTSSATPAQDPNMFRGMIVKPLQTTGLAQIAGSPIYGDGHNGDVVVPAGSTGFPNDVASRLSATANVGQTTVQIDTPTGFVAGDEVLIIQMQGTGAGTYEFAKMTAVSGNTLTLDKGLASAYTVGGTSTAVEYQIPPVITNVTKSTDNKGNGIFHATVTDDVSVFTATLLISGTHVAMNPIGGNVYEAVAPVPANQITQFQIKALDNGGNVSYYPPKATIPIQGYITSRVGYHACSQKDPCMPGSCLCSGDPVNTSDGSFSYKATDMVVPGIGGTDLVIERNYSAVAEEAQGIVNYVLDGNTIRPVVINPSVRPFGTNWSFPYSMRLDIVHNDAGDEAQVHYADGRIANFTRQSLGEFDAVEPGVYDTLTTTLITHAYTPTGV